VSKSYTINQNSDSFVAGFASPAGLATKFHNASSSIHAKGDLAFLNTWTYKLGTAVLTHFGRQQMFDLGVSMRLKYGTLLEGFNNVGLHVYFGLFD
jgi:hypothetical protein